MAGAQRKNAKSWLARARKWMIPAVLAGVATVITAATTDVLNSIPAVVGSVQCSISGPTAHESKSPYVVAVAKLSGDEEERTKSVIVSSLVAQNFSVVSDCAEGPDLSESSGTINDGVRKKADARLGKIGGDVLIFGSVNRPKVNLVFADRHGYCSQELLTTDETNFRQNRKISEQLSAALVEHTLDSLVHDCEARNLEKLDLEGLKDKVAKLVWIAKRDDVSKETLGRIWWQMGWARFALGYKNGGDEGALKELQRAESEAPRHDGIINLLWGAASFAENQHRPRLEQYLRLRANELLTGLLNDTPESASYIALSRYWRDPGLSRDEAAAIADQVLYVMSKKGAYMPDYDYNLIALDAAKFCLENPKTKMEDVERCIRNVRSIVTYAADNPKDGPSYLNDARFWLAFGLTRAGDLFHSRARYQEAFELVRKVTIDGPPMNRPDPQKVAELRAKLEQRLAKTT